MSIRTTSMRKAPLLATLVLAGLIMALGWGLLVASADVSAPPGPSGLESWFIQIDGIEGESTDAGHEGWIELTSVSHSIHVPQAPAGAAAQRPGRPKFNDIVVVKEVDKSTPKLMEAIARGTVHPEAKIELTRGSADGERTPYLMWELKNVQVTSYSISGDNEHTPTETISLNFEEIKVIYTPTEQTGAPGDPVEFEWNVRRNAP